MSQTTPPDETDFSAPNLADRVRAILGSSAVPLTQADVKKKLKEAGVPLTGKAKVTDEQILHVLDGGGFHVHPAATARGKPKYWHRAPLTVAERVAETVRTRVAALGDEPVKPGAGTLGKPGPRDGAEAQAAFSATLQELVTSGVLFEHPGGKYGKNPPLKPKWYEAAPHKTELNKAVAAARKVLSLGGVSADELFAVLREQLGLAAAPQPTAPTAPVPTPPPSKPVAPSTPAPVANLRTSLKEAYDHLCKFPEFRDKLVELPSLYHETAERMPGLTPEVFQTELWQMSRDYLIELHVLNEVYLAKEPHLAIRRNDRLYYYARWK